MHGRSPLRRQVQQLLLALLTVAASFVYLTRAQMTSVMGTTGMMGLADGMTDMPGMSGDADVQVLSNPAQRQGSAALSPDQSASLVGAPDLTDAAPNAPSPAAHDHAAHCIFCFTSAFALEADGAFMLLALGHWVWRALVCYARPHVLAARHVDARAPPAST